MAKSLGSALVVATTRLRFWIAFALLLFFAAAGFVPSDVLRAAEKGAESTANAKDDDSSGDGSEIDSDDSVTALVLPASLLPNPKMIDRMKFSQELRGLLM